MNAKRRRQIEKVINLLEEQRDKLEVIKDDEREAFDNLSENLQMSERGEQLEENADELDSAYDDLDDIICRLTELIEQ